MIKNLKAKIQKERDYFKKKYLPCKGELERSGWGGSRKMWRIARGIILEAVDKSGSFLDIGCANGVLARDLRRWVREDKGFNLIPYGIDLVDELIMESKKHNPGFEKNFVCADAMEFCPRRKFTFISTVFYGPHRDFNSFIKKCLNMLEPDGRLILTFYDEQKDLFRQVDEVIREKSRRLGFYFTGSAEIPEVAHIIWLEKSPKSPTSSKVIRSNR